MLQSRLVRRLRPLQLVPLCPKSLQSVVAPCPQSTDGQFVLRQCPLLQPRPPVTYLSLQLRPLNTTRRLQLQPLEPRETSEVPTTSARNDVERTRKSRKSDTHHQTTACSCRAGRPNHFAHSVRNRTVVCLVASDVIQTTNALKLPRTCLTSLSLSLSLSLNTPVIAESCSDSAIG